PRQALSYFGPVCLICFCLLGLVFSCQLAELAPACATQDWETALLDWFSGERRRPFVAALLVITALGSVPAIVLMALLGLIWTAIKPDWPGFAFIGASSLGVAALPFWLKTIFDRPRPPSPIDAL